ncbi:MAG TPA: hypothetical protein VF820_04645 [Patescibacteria group bacterium]
MKGRILFFSFIAFFSALFAAVTPAFASTTPDFPACSSPQGSTIASYDSGTHGIPGDSSTYTGSDTVYQVNESQVL